jgi:hypothetical protein
MPRGEKSGYTSKLKRMARHIEESYEKRGLSEDEAEGVPGQPSTMPRAGERIAGPAAARGSIRLPCAKAAAMAAVPPKEPHVERHRSHAPSRHKSL